MKRNLLMSALLCCTLLPNLTNAAVSSQKTESDHEISNFRIKEEAMNEKLSAKWDKLVGSLKEQWGHLTDQDLEKVKGKKDQLIGLIKEKYADSKEGAKEKYADSKEAIEKRINELLEKLD
ncbi:MAG: CsbD family protein [Pseudomonadota bacterium]|jgi:uncharacterized protein YjbJ (UPF0337 family)|nr:CsbD family protein [Alphaproteobacteria bacterium]